MIFEKTYESHSEPNFIRAHCRFIGHSRFIGEMLQTEEPCSLQHFPDKSGVLDKSAVGTNIFGPLWMNLSLNLMHMGHGKPAHYAEILTLLSVCVSASAKISPGPRRLFLFQ